jgi:hypothetical protein
VTTAQQISLRPLPTDRETGATPSSLITYEEVAASVAGALERQHSVSLRLIGLHVDESRVRVDFVLHLVPPVVTRCRCCVNGRMKTLTSE